MLKQIYTLSDRIRHFFHVVSNVRPIVWIGLYVAATPIFALIYWALPDAQFRIPDGAGTDYGSWLYYSIVTITTLGFGDYTPAHAWAQLVTAIEVMWGLVILGFFLNAVGSMKSEIDIESELEKQRRLHAAAEHDKLMKHIPIIVHNINTFLNRCYDVTTPVAKRKSDGSGTYNPDFTLDDMGDVAKATSGDTHTRTLVTNLVNSAERTSLLLDSLENRIDLTLWPDLLEDCFLFVANEQMFVPTDTADHQPTPEALADFIRKNADLAIHIESILTSIASTTAVSTASS